MEKRHKDILRPLVAGLRRLLAGTADGTRRGDLDRELERLGVAPDGRITLLDALPTLSSAERRARQMAEAELQQVADPKALTAARAAFVERAAYGWINRLLALRVLEARGLIDETLRANPAYDGLPEALYLLRQGEPGRAAGPDGGWWAVIEDACAAQAAALPGLFSLDASPQAGEARRADDTLRDPAIALRPSTAALLDCVALLGDAPAGTPPGRVEELRAAMDAAFADPDAIGWAYQFYQEEAKAQVYLRLKAGKKVVTRDEIAAATQLFTEPYMVKWLLQNSLGRSYHEAYPHSVLPATWDYYIRPEQLDAPAFTTLGGLTLLDPCMGSGHFLREAFDMFVAMYREQQPDLSAVEIADRILAEHLHGIDIDPRAAGLAAFTLYARAWELVRDERRARRQAGAGSYRPAAMNLATTPDRIASGALARHLQRHPEDRMLEPLLKGVFAALEQADILGSLLRPREHLQAAISELRKARQMGLGTPEEMDLQSAIEAVAQSDPAHLEEMLLDRVASGFAVEARGVGDVAAQLFGRAAERGVRLLQLLDRRYAVVVTNPPYMGSANMGAVLRDYVEDHYVPGKRDLYAAFILRCLELSRPDGREALVPPQTWMFQSSFADLRAIAVDKLPLEGDLRSFRGLLQCTILEAVAQLGRHAFSEIDPPANPMLFVLRNSEPVPAHRVWCCRLSASRPSEQQQALLRRAVRDHLQGVIFVPTQQDFSSIPDSPIVYWLSAGLISLFRQVPRVDSIADVHKGLDTADNDRFTRTNWEEECHSDRWERFPKGGGYQKWFGRSYHLVDWERMGARIKAVGNGTPRNEIFYGSRGLTYTEFGRGCLGVRVLEPGELFNTSSPGIISEDDRGSYLLAGLLNAHVSSFLIRTMQANARHLGEGYVAALPVAVENSPLISQYAEFCIEAKRLLARTDLLDGSFDPAGSRFVLLHNLGATSALHAVEGLINTLAVQELGLEVADIECVVSDVGMPSGWFKILQGYDQLPEMSPILPVPENAVRSIAMFPRQACPPNDLARLKAQFRTLYEAGPGLSRQEAVVGDEVDGEDSGISHAPLPVETFLEELSQKLAIHPISGYLLLQEIRAEGARCKPEERRQLEDHLSVLVLRLLGHRWPKQLEAGEPVPAWADSDGIIPLLPGTGERTLADRLRERLRDEDGNLGAQQAEALLAELTGRSLEEWLRRDFFTRHVRQFKYRPIAWQLASAPVAAARKGKGSTRQAPAFECVVYYHASGVSMLATIRTQYLEPLLRTERGRQDAARKAGDDTTAAQAHARVAELEAFAGRLRRVEEEGFACAELDVALAGEPLDRWSGDGILAPASRDELLSRERAWTVDINDGVRLNIAPLQLAGVLAATVLKDADAGKAIADRVRWRADERRWVREGVLPRCGWMGEEIPESPRWTERAPEREVERAKLERKRAEALAKLEKGG